MRFTKTHKDQVSTSSATDAIRVDALASISAMRVRYRRDAPRSTALTLIYGESILGLSIRRGHDGGGLELYGA